MFLYILWILDSKSEALDKLVAKNSFLFSQLAFLATHKVAWPDSTITLKSDILICSISVTCQIAGD